MYIHVTLGVIKKLERDSKLVSTKIPDLHVRMIYMYTPVILHKYIHQDILRIWLRLYIIQSYPWTVVVSEQVLSWDSISSKYVLSLDSVFTQSSPILGLQCHSKSSPKTQSCKNTSYPWTSSLHKVVLFLDCRAKACPLLRHSLVKKSPILGQCIYIKQSSPRTAVSKQVLSWDTVLSKFSPIL